MACRCSTAPSTCSTTPSCSRMPASTSPPATLDEFVAQAKATTKPGQWGSVWSWKQSEGADLRLGRDHVHPARARRSSTATARRSSTPWAAPRRCSGWSICSTRTRPPTRPRWSTTRTTCKQALETGTIALTYNWEGSLPEANDPAKSKAAPNVKIGAAARQQGCEKLQRQRLGGLGDPARMPRTRTRPGSCSSTWPARPGRRRRR